MPWIQRRHSPAGEENEELTKKIFGDLGAWQVSQMARHPQRPLHLDYIEQIFTDFDRAGRDRAADDKAIVGGIARLDGEPVMIIGHQKVARPRRRSSATSACRARKGTARPCA